MPYGQHFRCCIRGECLPGKSEEYQRPQTQYPTYAFILPALAVAHEASNASRNVFAVKDFQCRGCESFEQVEPFCGRLSPQAKSRNRVRDLRKPFCGRLSPQAKSRNRVRDLRKPFCGRSSPQAKSRNEVRNLQKPCCGSSSPQAKSPTAFSPQFTTTLAIVSDILRGMQQ